MWISVQERVRHRCPKTYVFRFWPGSLAEWKHHAYHSRRLPQGQDQVYSTASPGVRFGHLFYEITARPRPPKSGPIRNTFVKKICSEMECLPELYLPCNV